MHKELTSVFCGELNRKSERGKVCTHTHTHTHTHFTLFTLSFYRVDTNTAL